MKINEFTSQKSETSRKMPRFIKERLSNKAVFQSAEQAASSILIKITVPSGLGNAIPPHFVKSYQSNKSSSFAIIRYDRSKKSPFSIDENLFSIRNNAVNNVKQNFLRIKRIKIHSSNLNSSPNQSQSL